MTFKLARVAATTAVLILNVALIGCAEVREPPDSAYDPVPDLFDREILPVTAALPTAACIVHRYTPDVLPVPTDHLVVGMADGRVASFHGAGGSMVGITSFMAAPGEPIDEVDVYRDPRAGGLGTEHVVLARHGRALTALSLENMSSLGGLELPPPAIEWNIHTLRDSSRHDGSGTRAIACDGRTVYLLESHHAGTMELKLRALFTSDAPVEVTELSDGVAVAGGDSVWSVAGSGRVRRAAITEDGSLDTSLGRCALAPGGSDSTLVVCSLASDGRWVRREVALPGSLAAATVVSDSLVLAGGGRLQIPEYEIGWLALIDSAGRIVATGDHPAPVVLLTEVGGFLAVQGRNRNLSVYDMRLNPVWDRASQVNAVALLPCHFNADDSADLAVVASRSYSIRKSYGDMLDEAIGDWAFMKGAVLVPNPIEGREPSYDSTLPHLAFFSGNEMRLRRMVSESSDEARSAASDGRYADAVGLAVRARAAAAVLGDVPTERALTLFIADAESMPRRIDAALLAALLLALAGAATLALCMRGRVSHRFSLWSGVGLLAAAAVATLVLRAPPMGWTMFVGGSLGLGAAIAGEAGKSYLAAIAGPRRTRGAPIEELIIGIAEFKHGGAEGGHDEGRKNITTLSYLAQDMLESLDDLDRFGTLRDRLALRAEAFLHSKYQLTRLLLSHAAEAKLAGDEVRNMAEAADRIKEGLETVLEESDPGGRAATPSSRGDVESALLDIQKGRDDLVRAADRAWSVVKRNPGCSVGAGVRRTLDQKRESLEAAGVRVLKELHVGPDKDAVSLFSSELDFVLENLLSNAIRHMREDGDREIRIEVSGVGPLCKLRVRDSGQGISEEMVARLFAGRSSDGTTGGFGLPNSREKLRRRGGDIEVEWTEAGVGTTFLVTIPFWQAGRSGENDER